MVEALTIIVASPRLACRLEECYGAEDIVLSKEHRRAYRAVYMALGGKVHDTIYQAKHDTIPQPYPVIKEVEKKLSKPQKGLMGIGLLSLMGILIFIASKLKRYIP